MAWVKSWVVAWVVAWVSRIVWVVAISPIGIIAYIPVPVVPRVARITIPRVVEWVYVDAPAVVPRRRVDAERYVRCTPRAKHRGNILWLYPHLIARYHNVVEGRVVGCSVAHSVACRVVVVTRWHLVGWRVEAVETASVGTLVTIGHYRRVGVVVCCLRSVGLRLCHTSIPHSLTSLSQGALCLRFSL